MCIRDRLMYRDEFGHDHYIKRDVDRTTYELSDEGAVEIHVPIEGYDQDRIAAIIRGYRDHPRQLLAFLDRFADLGAVTVEMKSLRADLAANRDALLPLRGSVAKLEKERKSLEETRLKLKACLLYTPDAADALLGVDLGERCLLYK